MKKITQKGFAHPGLLLLLVVLVAVALIGYKVSKTHNDTTSNTVSSAPSQTIPVVKTKADLNTVETTLNNQNIDGNLNPDSLNQDVQSLL